MYAFSRVSQRGPQDSDRLTLDWIEKTFGMGPAKRLRANEGNVSRHRVSIYRNDLDGFLVQMCCRVTHGWFPRIALPNTVVLPFADRGLCRLCRDGSGEVWSGSVLYWLPVFFFSLTFFYAAKIIYLALCVATFHALIPRTVKKSSTELTCTG
ncbi:hypothetical protein F5Y17DRAFT_427172 [Xylariaceae sp. FL0594]|nr:hypothetical protein F5Y17DRAFT_427172 [Xylariaceae sp. FL0594]